MSEYVSKFTGQEIDEFLQKSKDISKTAQEVNTSLATVDSIKSGIDNAASGEVLLKDSTGELKGSGIVDEGDKIFFPKDGRFPSGSVDVGPAVTISENGGWVQNHTNTLNKDYIFLDYEVDKTGTKRPSYAKRDAEQLNVIINGTNSTTMQNVTTFDYTPSYAAQINALYLDFAAPVTNLRAEIVSKVTGLPIKYIPNEQVWKNGIGGLNLSQGVHNVLGTPKQTPFSALTTYELEINIVANGPVSLMGNGVLPYMAADLQVITEIGVLLLGEGTGSPDDPSQIRDKLLLLSGNDRLSITALKDVPEGLIAETPITIRNKLETLVSDSRLSHTAIKDLVLFDIALNAKLSGIEENAEVNPTASEVKSLYESNADTNVFDDATKYKLTNIEEGAKVNVQADWSQTDLNADDYIKNKPIIYNSVGGGYTTASIDTICQNLETYYKINATLTPWAVSKDFAFDGINNRIEYNGQAQNICANVSIVATANSNNLLSSFSIFKNDLEVQSATMKCEFNTNSVLLNVFLSSELQLQNGDYLDIRVKTGSNNILVTTDKMQITLR